MKKILIILFTLITLSAYADCEDGITATTPASRFTINGDNTVTDIATGLTWMRCSLGQKGRDCSGGRAKKYIWSGALNEVANHHNGWRLPNIRELVSIVENKCFGPAINTDIFPNTPSGFFWSSSPFVGHNASAWFVFFHSGEGGYDSKDSTYYVRLVRGGQ